VRSGVLLFHVILVGNSLNLLHVYCYALNGIARSPVLLLSQGSIYDWLGLNVGDAGAVS